MNGKLRSDRGETLVETLASILVATLSVTLLFGAVMASASMDRIAQETDESYYGALSQAESRAISAGAGQIEIKNNRTGGSKTLDVELYGGEEMYSYARRETGP